MLVQLLASPEQGFLHLEGRRELLKQSADGMPPGAAVRLKKYCFEPFFGALLGGKTGPLVASDFQGMPGELKIPVGLTQPILIVYRHSGLSWLPKQLSMARSLG